MNYQICNKCLMDTSHFPEISFNEYGVCSFCLKFKDYKDNILSKIDNDIEFNKAIRLLKSSGVGKKYDCILGLSGGVDSSYLALKLHEHGVRPLLVQLDNGWNTELASLNIQLIVDKFGFDLFTYVIDWEEFKDIQLSFIKASVRNIEAPTDHAIMAILYKTAIKNKIKYIISGVNYQTEFTSSNSYGHSSADLKIIEDIHNKFGTVKRKTYPLLPYWKRVCYDFLFAGISYVTILNYIDYNKRDSIQELKDKIGWKPYKGKHFESSITMFQQSYYLPVKFGLDKRRLHLSDLIRTNQITRMEGLIELESPPMEEKKLNELKNYISKKFGITSYELDEFIGKSEIPYSEYDNYDKQKEFISLIFNFIIKCRSLFLTNNK